MTMPDALVQLQSADSTIGFSYDAAGNLTAYDDGVTYGSYSYKRPQSKAHRNGELWGFHEIFQATPTRPTALKPAS